MLTTGVDNIVGTAGNDTILGSNDASGTFNIGDNIDGGAGVDTLVIANDATSLTLNAKTVTNVENFKVINGAANFATLNLNQKAFDTVTVDYAGTDHSSDLYIDGIKADTDLVVENVSADGSYVYRNNNGVYSTLTGSVEQNNTFNNIDFSADNGYFEFDNYSYFAAATELNLTTTVSNLITGGDTSTGSDETVYLYNYVDLTADNATVNLTYNLTNVELADSYTDITAYVENEATVAKADVVNVVFNLDKVDGIEADINTNNTGESSESDVATINVGAGGVANSYGSNDFELDGFETININVNGEADLGDIEANSSVGVAQTINIVANANLTIGDFDEADDQEVTVNLSGAGDVTIDFYGDNHGFTLNGGTATGNLDLEVGSNSTYALNVTTGSGDDKVTLVNAFELNADGDAFLQVIDGGDGVDTFEIGAANMVTSQALLGSTADAPEDFSGAIKNFERLSLTGFAAQVIDATTLGFNHVTIDGYTAAGSLTVEDAATVVVTGTGTTSAAIIVDGAATGTQSLNLTVKGADGIALNDLTVANVETISIVSSASAADATTPGANTVDLIAAAATKLNISGATELVFGATANLAKVATVAAADFDAGLTIDLTSSTVATTVTVGDGDNTITGSATKANTITTGAGFDTIVGGAGNDVISTGNGGSEITGGAGKDTITLGSGAAAEDVDTIIFTAVTDSQGVTVDVINGFQANVQATTDTNGDDIVDETDLINDVLDLSGVVIGTATYAGEANGYGAVLTSLTGDGVNSQAVLDTSTSTLYIDVDGSGTLDSFDMAIQLTGVTDLSAANFAFV